MTGSSDGRCAAQSRLACLAIGLVLLGGCRGSTPSAQEQPADTSTTASTTTDEVTLLFDHSNGCRVTGVEFGSPAGVITADLPEPGPLCTSGLDTVVLVDDFNFDGIVDIGVLSEIPISDGLLYRYWLRSPDGSLTESDALEEASLYGPEFDSERKRIMTSHFDTPDVEVTLEYEWQEGVLKRVACSPDFKTPAAGTDQATAKICDQL
jgi:hypothetical protein